MPPRKNGLYQEKHSLYSNAILFHLQLFAEVMTLPKNRLRKSNLNTPHLRAHFSANSGLIDMIPGIGAPGFTFWFHIQIPMGQESSGFKKIDQELNENGQSEPVVRKTGVEF
ncbi:hypothetical protein B0H17DRAFT_1135569 [Mycena rosella]|uniref:Uncharacterized protein n=1 Tax=Mycena rosella TaxID=1033263 RepID=A0AAD7DEU4_MYCRO|nr:hypothetical protein B0H17DRAFT_1135569 [Mycena rosella]